MKEKIVKDFQDLSEGDLRELVLSLKNCKYSVYISAPNFGNKPKGIFPVLTKASSYRKIFQDDSAYYLYIVLQFHSAYSARIINIPICVFGVSPVHRMTFPIVIGKICGSIVMLSKDQLSAILAVPADACDDPYGRLLQIRKELIDGIFRLYRSMGNSYVAAMAWSVKGEKSLTRVLAESNGFIRTEDNNHKSELYVSEPLSQERLQYLLECHSRWGGLNQPSPESNWLAVAWGHVRSLLRKKNRHLTLYYSLLTA